MNQMSDFWHTFMYCLAMEPCYDIGYNAREHEPRFHRKCQICSVRDLLSGVRLPQCQQKLCACFNNPIRMSCLLHIWLWEYTALETLLLCDKSLSLGGLRALENQTNFISFLTARRSTSCIVKNYSDPVGFVLNQRSGRQKFRFLFKTFQNDRSRENCQCVARPHSIKGRGG